MRRDSFLRGPVRADHQARMLALAIGEVALAGDPAADAPFPQTLEIGFDIAAGTTEVQVALPWAGLLRFIPDSTLNHPTTAAEATEARFPGWAVTGDLLLLTHAVIGPAPGLTDGFAAHLPLVSPLPGTLRLSKVRLTRDFLFATLSDLPRQSFVFEGALVARDDPQHHAKLLVGFLAGRTQVPFQVDPADPARDDTRREMPSVALAAPGTRSLLRVALASVSEEILSTTWFDTKAGLDDVAGVPLVPPALATLREQYTNPAHPSHSAIPAWMLFQQAAAAAWAPDHGPATPLRAAVSAPRPDGRPWRRVEIARPTIPGPPLGDAARRPWPQYQLAWQPEAGGATEALRLPLSGVAYLPLADGAHRFRVIPRNADPALVATGDHIRLSQRAPAPARYIGLPATTLSVPVAAGATTVTIYAHAQPYDSRLAWQRFRAVEPARGPLKARAKAAWNAEVFDWFVQPTTAAWEPYRALYGYIRESAGRHGLSPEFVQVIFFGEGGALAIGPAGAFDPAEPLDAFGFVGLDLILYRLGRLPPGAPAVPPEVPAGAVEERAEYAFNLQTQGYVDAATAATVTFRHVVRRTEAGFTRTLQTGRVAGWAAAIELLTAELHARLDEMEAYLAAKAPPVMVATENERRFLAYVRFNARPTTAQDHADNLATRLRRWAGPPPPNNENVRFNTIQRIAVTEWHEAAGAFRQVE
jgi:hypothetical protein